MVAWDKMEGVAPYEKRISADLGRQSMLDGDASKAVSMPFACTTKDIKVEMLLSQSPRNVAFLQQKSWVNKVCIRDLN